MLKNGIFRPGYVHGLMLKNGTIWTIFIHDVRWPPFPPGLHDRPSLERAGRLYPRRGDLRARPDDGRLSEGGQAPGAPESAPQSPSRFLCGGAAAISFL